MFREQSGRRSLILEIIPRPLLAAAELPPRDWAAKRGIGWDDPTKNQVLAKRVRRLEAWDIL
jgi:hypothetical protein